MGLFNKQKQPVETFTAAPVVLNEGTEEVVEEEDDFGVDEDSPIATPQQMQQQIKKVVRSPQRQTQPIQQPQRPQQRQPAQPQTIQPQIIEREITLSLINEKLNFIISKIQEE